LDGVKEALAELKRGNFTFPINGGDKRLLVDGHSSPQDAWYLTATSIKSYFLLKNGKIVSKPHLSSQPAQTVSARDLLIVEDEVKKGLRLIYTKPEETEEKSEPAKESKPKFITEENEDEVPDPAETDTRTEPITRPAETSTAETDPKETAGWHKRLPIEKQGRQARTWS
jgi:hypothetical protein